MADEISQCDSIEVAVWRALKMAGTSSLKQSAQFGLALFANLSDASEREAAAGDRAES